MGEHGIAFVPKKYLSSLLVYHFAFFVESEVDESNLKKPTSHFGKLVNLVEQRRQSMNRDDFRLIYSSKLKPLFHDYVQCLTSQNRTAEALSAADGGRARALGDSVGASVSISPVEIARRSGRTILYYSLGKQKSLLWVIRPSGITIRELVDEKTIGALVDVYNDFIRAQRKPEDYTAERDKLFQAVLEPARTLIGPHHKLLIIPDAPLHSINFETLPSFGEKLYLIEDHEIELAPSLRLLKDSGPSRTGANSPLAIGAPDHFPGGFVDLPGVKREMALLHQFFPPRFIHLSGRAHRRQKAISGRRPGKIQSPALCHSRRGHRF